MLAMTEQVSDRLLDQRLRNRMMEAVHMLTDWEDTLGANGAGEYFNSFFDFFPDNPPLRPNSALTGEEVEALTKVLALMDQAANATAHHVTEAELIASGWPQRIGSEAQSAFDVMCFRGGL